MRPHIAFRLNKSSIAMQVVMHLPLFLQLVTVATADFSRLQQRKDIVSMREGAVLFPDDLPSNNNNNNVAGAIPPPPSWEEEAEEERRMGAEGCECEKLLISSLKEARQIHPGIGASKGI